MLRLFLTDLCYVNGSNGEQNVYNHTQIVEVGKCNLTKCLDGIVEEEFRYPYMVYCENTDPTMACEVSTMKKISYEQYFSINRKKHYWE